jgi:hypothetical protein
MICMFCFGVLRVSTLLFSRQSTYAFDVLMFKEVWDGHVMIFDNSSVIYFLCLYELATKMYDADLEVVIARHE